MFIKKMHFFFSKSDLMATKKSLNFSMKKNKAVYTSRNRVRVGRGSDDKGLPKHLGRNSNAKTARNAKKS